MQSNTTCFGALRPEANLGGDPFPVRRTTASIVLHCEPLFGDRKESPSWIYLIELRLACSPTKSRHDVDPAKLLRSFLWVLLRNPLGRWWEFPYPGWLQGTVNSVLALR